MAGYRYLLADALTGQLLDELPLDCGPFGQQISGIGTVTATLAVADADLSPAWRQATAIKRTLLLIVRDGNPDPVWGGIVMKHRPQGTGHTTAEITAETLEGYWGRRRIKTDLAASGDLFDVVRAIIGQVQSVTGGSLRMAITDGAQGTTTTITYLGKDRTKALDAITRLAEVSSFEFTIRWTRSGQVFTPTMVLAAPALNTTLDPLLVEFPGSLEAPVDAPADGGDAPNALTGVGADSGGAPLMVEAVDPGELAAGYPIYEDEFQAKDETDLTRLTARTATALQGKLVDHMVPTVTLRAPGVPGDVSFADLALGQPVRVRCSCPYHGVTASGAPGFDDSSRRITGWTVDPKTDKPTLALGAVTGLISPPMARRDPIAYLRDLDRRLRTLETST